MKGKGSHLEKKDHQKGKHDWEPAVCYFVWEAVNQKYPRPTVNIIVHIKIQLITNYKSNRIFFLKKSY